MPHRELLLDEVDEAALEQKENRAKKRQYGILSKLTEPSPSDTPGREVVFRFGLSPVEAVAGSHGVTTLRCEKTRLEGDATSRRAVSTGEFEELPSGLVLRSVGYKSEPLDGMEAFPSGVVPNVHGRVASSAIAGGAVGVYVAGWLKRGPSGIIGTNIPDAKETAAAILEDRAAENLPVPKVSGGGEAVVALLEAQGHPVVTWDGWKVIDQYEVEEGGKKNKLREKVTTVDEMLRLAHTT